MDLLLFHVRGGGAMRSHIARELGGGAARAVPNCGGSHPGSRGAHRGITVTLSEKKREGWWSARSYQDLHDCDAAIPSSI